MSKTTITAQDCIALKVVLDSYVTDLEPRVEVWRSEGEDDMREWLDRLKALQAKLQRKIAGK